MWVNNIIPNSTSSPLIKNKLGWKKEKSGQGQQSGERGLF